MDFEKLDFVDEKDPRRAELSYTKHDFLLKEMLAACQDFIARELALILTARIKDVLGAEDWKLLINTNDSNIVEFEYPTSIKAKLDYIRPRVILELGTHAEPVPNEDYDVMPFAAEHFPQLFIEPACSVATVVAKRTFWEKATILHAEYHWSPGKPMPLRYSRHYADVAAMGQARVVDEALADIELLNSVTIHKDLFYHSGWAQYNLARPGSFYLMPRGERLSAIGRDYREMSAMFFSEPPEFESILEQLLELEKRINNT